MIRLTNTHKTLSGVQQQLKVKHVFHVSKFDAADHSCDRSRLI